jgi:hypothetical protein
MFVEIALIRSDGLGRHFGGFSRNALAYCGELGTAFRLLDVVSGVENLRR